MTNLDFLRREERLEIKLKALYKSYGFKEYKLPGFEEYSLYADNKSFLGGKDVISFSCGKKLLALRPDVTLSVAKNVSSDGETRKLFYDEKVYRRSAGGDFSEVSQIGVEVIGDVDIAAEAELCTLMIKTLSGVDSDFVLDITHMGIVVKILDRAGIKSEDYPRIFGFLESKNVHDFARFAAQNGIDNNAVSALELLIKLPATSQNAIKGLGAINKIIDISAEIAELEALTRLAATDGVNIDFSIGGDAEYYNGVIFKGYVKGVPHAVLSGGRYDKLLNKFEKSSKALGFALYLGELAKYFTEAPVQLDAVLVYNKNNAEKALETAEDLRKSGARVLMTKSVPKDFKGEVYFAEDKND